jgi:hypothetical protein
MIRQVYPDVPQQLDRLFVHLTLSFRRFDLPISVVGHTAAVPRSPAARLGSASIGVVIVSFGVVVGSLLLAIGFPTLDRDRDGRGRLVLCFAVGSLEMFLKQQETDPNDDDLGGGATR